MELGKTNDPEILEMFRKDKERREKMKQEPANIEELKEVLYTAGAEWRNSHFKENKKTGEIEILPIKPRAVADILLKYVKFAIIGRSERELEKAPLVFYDPGAGIYKNNERLIKSLIYSVERDLNIRQYKETLNFLSVGAKAKRPTRDKNLIVVGNGVFNKHTKTLEPFSPQYTFTTKVQTNYNPKATEPTFNGWCLSDWFKSLAQGDEHKERLLWQAIACTVNPNYTAEAAIFLVDEGQGRTGKSTFERLLQNITGEGNYSSLKIDEFENDFKLAHAYGSTLLIGDDNHPDNYNKRSDNFKSVLTGETILVNPKGIAPFSAMFNCFVVQSMNGLPRFGDKSDALLRRIRVVEFNKQYPDTPEGRKIKQEYIKDKRLLEWCLKQALELDFDILEDTEESKRNIYDIKLDNDPVVYFVENYFGEITSDRIPVVFLFKYFLNTMTYENNPQTMKQNTFTRRLKPILEAKGWTYSRNNLAPGKYWNEEDKKLLAKYGAPFEDRTLEIDVKKKVPLFECSKKKKPLTGKKLKKQQN